jgi:hypothetical protein
MLSRRFFLKVGAGLISFLPAARALANPEQPNRIFLPVVTSPSSSDMLDVPSPPPLDWNPDAIIENYVDGTIVDIQENHILVDASGRGLMTLRTSSATLFWKGGWNSRFPIKVGDHIDAWGQPQADGRTINLEKMWANLVDVKGTVNNFVRGASLASVDFNDRSGDTWHTVLDSNTEILLPSDNPEPKADVHSVQIEGEYLGQLIGIRQDDGTILATRLFLDVPVRNRDSEANQKPLIDTASGDAIQAAFYVGHMARYTLCNGSNGACGNCNNNSNHIAWTKLSTTGCNYCCQCSLPWLACNAQVWVRNDCNNTALYGAVKDCSTMSSGGCRTNSYCNGNLWSGRPALLEVTGGMYLNLGGVISDGRTPVTIYV